MLKMIVAWMIARILLAIIGIVVVIAILTSLFGCSSQQAAAPAATTSAASRTRTAVEAEPTETMALATAVPTATPTATSIWDIGGQSGTGLQPNPPTRVAKTATPLPTAKATLRPGETPAKTIDTGIPGIPTIEIPNMPGWTPMPTVHIEAQLPGGATPTATPKPCSNWFGNIGCPSAPKSDQPAAPQPKPASGGENQNEFPIWLDCLIGLGILAVIVVIVGAVLFRTGIFKIEQQQPPP